MFPIAVLAGGLATRLRPLTKTLPKSLLDVAGEPFISHQLRLFEAQEITRVVLCVSYLGERIRDYVGNGRRFGLDVEYSFDGPVLLGTAGAVRKALPLLGDAFFVTYGDSYLPCDFRVVQQAFTDSGKLALMTIYRNQDRWDRSNVVFAEGKIAAYDKESRDPAMRYIDYGLGAFHRCAFESVPAAAPCDLAALYGRLLEEGKLASFEVRERFYEIGSLTGLRELSAHLAGRD